MTVQNWVHRRLRSSTAKASQWMYDQRPRSTRLPNNVGIGRDVRGLENVRFAGNNGVGDHVRFVESCQLGYGTSLNRNGFYNGPLTVGAYCQFAPYVAVYATNHPIDHLAINTTPRVFDGRLGSNVTSRPVTIGSDVWIGHGATVLGGVVIGDGAVVAASAVVTKDVEPFTIVAGNPARPVAPRFDDRIIALISELQWWRLPPDELSGLEPLFTTQLDPATDKAVKLLEDAVEAMMDVPRLDVFDQRPASTG